MGRGRKPLWDELDIPSKLESIKGWALQGSTDEEIWTMLGVSKDTFYKWKREYPEFKEAIKKGKYISNGELLNAAFKSATGYKAIKQQAIKLKDIEYVDGKPYPIERIEVINIVEEIPGNPTMNIFMLKNRLPDQYRDKKELEVTENKLEDYFEEDEDLCD